jgi:hypothetical protein
MKKLQSVSTQLVCETLTSLCWQITKAAVRDKSPCQYDPVTVAMKKGRPLIVEKASALQGVNSNN